jgi:hypothetical protein
VKPAAALLVLVLACAAPAPAREAPCEPSGAPALLNAAQALPAPRAPQPAQGGPLAALRVLIITAAATLGPAGPPVAAGLVGLLGSLLRRR